MKSKTWTIFVIIAIFPALIVAILSVPEVYAIFASGMMWALVWFLGYLFMSEHNKNYIRYENSYYDFDALIWNEDNRIAVIGKSRKK